MAKLVDRTREELANWRKLLPAAWRTHFQDIELAFDAIDLNAEIDANEEIWPGSHEGPAGSHIFKAHQDLGPERVRVVVFGNDPYTKLTQATGRSFEQGDLTDWAADIRARRRISPSLQSLMAAAAATNPEYSAYDLTSRQIVYDDYKDDTPTSQPLWFAHIELARGLAAGRIKLPPAQQVFGHWARQGVLWLNRTLTYTRWDDEHRQSHKALWARFTQRTLEVLVRQAKRKKSGMGKAHALVFVLWGSSAADLEPVIEDLAKRESSGEGSIRTVKAGHPQWPEGYFRSGNPLAAINEALGSSGPAIRWL